MFWRSFCPENVRAVFVWLGGVARDGDIIRFDNNGASRFFCFDFPVLAGTLPRRRAAPGTHEAPAFIVSCGGGRLASGDAWVSLFSSPELRVFERRRRVASEVPLRWGLTDKDRAAAMRIARHSLERFLREGVVMPRTHFDDLDEKFFERADVDVALWVRGRLRGSAVVENRHFGEGIAEAARIASRDSRFKPLAPEELAETRVEVTLMHGLRPPLAKAEIERRAVYPEKGYPLTYKGSRGWYLPEVLNVRRFRDLGDFLGDLAEEKARLSRNAWAASDVRVFEVDDFIETPDRAGIVALSGPTVRPAYGDHRSQFLPRLHAAAAWLCDIQEEDGNLPPIVNPLTGARSQVDWTRLAFTAWALAEFGIATGTARYREAA